METQSGTLIQRRDVGRLLKALFFTLGMGRGRDNDSYASGYYDGYKDAITAVGIALDCNETEPVSELRMTNE